MIHSFDRKKLNFKFPISIYMIVYTYFLAAIGANIYVFSHFRISDLTSEMWIAILILFGTYLWPIQYKHKNTIISLTFQLPILFLFGLVPVYLVTFVKLIFPNGYYKDVNLIKNLFNFSNTVIPYTLTYLTFSMLGQTFPSSEYKMINLILISSFLLIAVQIIALAIVVYLEKGINYFKQQYRYIFNLLATNVMNGIITYYLYQALHIPGIFIAILYAILFSKRSQYQAAYDKKKMNYRSRSNGQRWFLTRLIMVSSFWIKSI
ncbi:hypothetical protein [Tepidibacillus marianensis]|uniref:hypothetical protein n=1 Tax=Tepidibacillus marianensis TaxID=3131995 RepID=UPI0030D195E0